MFFELCEEVCGGSPATRDLSSGIETGDLEESSSGSSSPQSLEHSPQPESSEPSGSLPAAVVVRHRRDLLQAQLNGHRSDRLKRKLPADHIRDGFSLMRDLIHAHPHSSSGGHGHFQEQSSPFMQRRPHPPTPTYTPRINLDTFSYRRSLFQED
ncbi:hypothetical protein CgunFtcFv8_025580 [Champsocephalus gunnari]|uniref:Uncharacterized protein n=1 Tax=Champsocephalus gunnari TaxID=52237 RepID=A0AAN8H305_CHAGU|nr:hypothetical protein CgunFtcFv8_025580 [Champsocephalus gunnari]